MGYIKSKLVGTSIFIATVMLFFTLILMLAIIEDIKMFSGEYLRLLFLVVFLFPFIKLLKPIRYIIIKGDKLTYYSFIRPFGRVLYFSDYIGRIVFFERNAAGKHKIVYLIDKNNRTDLRITGQHYKNFEKILSAIPLRTMDFKPTMKDDFKLFLLGRITIKEGRNDKKAEKSRDKFMTAIQIAGVIGLSLMILGYLLRWILG